MVRIPTVPFPVPSWLFYGWVIVATSLIVNIGAAGTSPIVFSFFISPMTDALDTGRSELALASTFRLVASGLAAPVIGALVDRVGARGAGVFAGFMAGGCVCALAFADSLWAVYLLFALMGTVVLGSPIITGVPVAKWFIAKRGRAMAISIVGLPLGIVIAVPVTQWLIDSIGWRDAWLVLGISVVVIIVPFSAIFYRRSPEDLGLEPDGVAQAPGKAGLSAAGPPVAEVDWTLRRAIRLPSFWTPALALALVGFGLNGTLLHRVAFWEDIGMSLRLVAWGTTLDPLMVAVSALGFGLLAERVSVRHISVFMGVTFSAALLPLVLTTGQAYTIFLHGFLWGTAAGAFMSVNNMIWPSYFGRRYLGAIRGTATLMYVAGAGVGGPVYGLLLDAGIESDIVWGMSIGVVSLASLLLFTSRPPRVAAGPPA